MKPKILIVKADYYWNIATALGAAAEVTLSTQSISKVTYKVIEVPGVFEIPSAIKFAWDDHLFDGCVTLGCVIRGETDHYNHICREVSRALMDLSIALKIPHGFGIITCENREQAWKRADIEQKNIGARAANACLQLIEIRATNTG